MNALLRFMMLFGFQLSPASIYCPDRCICLWYADYSLKINCSARETPEVSNLYVGPQVKILDLSHNDIQSYSQSRSLKAVEEINLSNNRLIQVSFRYPMKHLKSIDLSYNSFKHLNMVDVRQLKSLRKLDLSFNARLSDVSGFRSDSLEDLNVSHCFISSVEDDFLVGLPHIRSIDISFNFLRSLKNIKSKSLRILDASNSNIETLTHDDIVNLPELVKLNVSFNFNLKIELSHEDSCWKVQVLDLSYSKLTSLNEMFPFCSLTSLNASYNQIEIIEVRTFFNNWELIFVNLSNNRISEIDGRAFFTADKLKVLDLSENLIENVFFTLHLKRVENLNLSRNRIANLIGLMLKRTIDLNLSQNKLTEIWINFNENGPDLKKIDLSSNEIKRLGRISSKSLEFIDLSFNLIETIDPNAFENVDSLITINLLGNRLTTLDFRTVQSLENLKHLILARNPWTCKCEDEEFKVLYEHLINGGRSQTNFQDLKCKKTNDTWTNTCIEQWRRDKEWKKTIYSLTVTLAVSLLVAAAVYACKFFKIKNSNASGGEEEEEDENAVQTLPNFSSDSAESVQGAQNLERYSNRNSTPPPNYEAALLLPKLGEEVQITRSVEAMTSDNDGGSNVESDRNENFTQDDE